MPHKNKADRLNALTTWRLKNRAERKIFVLEYLTEHTCVDCGIDDPIVLEFDHVRGDKITSISNMVNNCCAYEKILNEIKKCDVRCANCHRIKTTKQLGYWTGSLPLNEAMNVRIVPQQQNI